MHKMALFAAGDGPAWLTYTLLFVFGILPVLLILFGIGYLFYEKNRRKK